MNFSNLRDPKNTTSDKSLRERLHVRTRELAVLAGRQPFEITQRDYEQAKREITGETALDR